MPTYRLLVFLAVWRRPEITEICFMGICRLRESGLFPIEALAVISEESMIPLCEKYGIRWCMTENSPLGAKKNFGLKEAYKLEWDYLVEIGSDDLLKTEYLTTIAPYLGKHPVVTIRNIVFLNSEDGECRMYNKGTTYGIGRAISRKVLDKVGPTLWPDIINKGLDNSSTFFMARHGFLEKRVRTEEPIGIDIKSDVNIWKFNYLLGSDYSFEKAMEGLSEREKTAIRCLVTKNKSAGLIDA